MKRPITLAAVCLLATACSGPPDLHDLQAAPHLVALMPEVQAEREAKDLRVSVEREGIETLVKEAGIRVPLAIKAAACQSYELKDQEIRVFVFEMETEDAARAGYRSLETGTPTPIPGLGVQGRTRALASGRYEVETWTQRFLIRATANSDKRDVRQQVYSACEGVLERAMSEPGAASGSG